MYGKELLANFARMNIYTVPLADETLVTMASLPMKRTPVEHKKMTT